MDGRLSLDGAIYRAPYGANKRIKEYKNKRQRGNLEDMVWFDLIYHKICSHEILESWFNISRNLQQ